MLSGDKLTNIVNTLMGCDYNCKPDNKHFMLIS